MIVISEKPLFDLEGKIKNALKGLLNNVKTEKLGLTEGESPPHVELADPSKVDPSKVETTMPEEAAGAQEQIETTAKQAMMPFQSPKQHTLNYERFVQ